MSPVPFELITTLAAALYVNLVEHPARMTLPPEAALAEFGAPRGWLVGACLSWERSCRSRCW